MLDDVRRFIHREKLFDPQVPLWVGVSGGVDSMVLLHVLRALGHDCHVAHVDHGLRGDESDGDRHLVEAYCSERGIPFTCSHMDVRARAMATGVSLQMAARELRFAWFASLVRDKHMPFALAHHADDAVETLFINLMRGTGAHGWGTISPKTGAFVRPLLSVGRADVLRYAAEHAVPFREDSSNRDPKYLRNRIRHEVLPLLEDIRPGAGRTMARSVHLLRELETAAGQNLHGALDGPHTGAEGRVVVPFAWIRTSPAPTLLLLGLLRERGFHPEVIDRVHDAVLEHSTGATFCANGHVVTIDRDALVISKTKDALPTYVIDPECPERTQAPFAWTLFEGGHPGVPANMHEALLDADRLVFPLEMRPWRLGDRMRPIGLGGSKLISDILIDAKVPVADKSSTYVLTHAGEPIWLVGHRLAEGSQATALTRRFLRITWPRGG